jgi:hypothetical protein
MDAIITHYAIFLLATFAAALVAGLSGFAFGLIAAAAWLHILSPLQTAALIIAFGLIVQGVGVWKLRHALDWQRLWPFLLGAAFGVPLGVAILRWADPRQVQAGVGALLVLYAIHGLARPTLAPVRGGGAALDVGVGFLNGVLGGLTGLAGILVVIWCGLRGWGKDVQRGNLSAVRRRRLCDDGVLARGRGRHNGRHRHAVPGRPAGAAGRHLARLEALRTDRRDELPPHRAGAAAAVRTLLGAPGVARVRRARMPLPRARAR